MRPHLCFNRGFLDINMMYFGASIYTNRIGTFALSIAQMGYGDMDVTTMAQQDGTGKSYR